MRSAPVSGLLTCRSRFHRPISRASRARVVCRLVETCQPTIRREYMSITNAA